jgi:hypothetical protein
VHKGPLFSICDVQVDGDALPTVNASNTVPGKIYHSQRIRQQVWLGGLHLSAKSAPLTKSASSTNSAPLTKSAPSAKSIGKFGHVGSIGSMVVDKGQRTKTNNKEPEEDG